MEDDTGYEVVFTLPDDRTCSLACAQSLCPQDLTARVVGDTIELTGTNIAKAWDHFEISRGGVVLDAAVSGTATSWTDPSVVLVHGSSYDYLVHPVAVAGGELPDHRSRLPSRRVDAAERPAPEP